MIKDISCSKDGIVKLLDGTKHQYQDGDYVVIDHVQGMNYLELKMQQMTEAQQFYNTMTKSKLSNSINGRVFRIMIKNWN